MRQYFGTMLWRCTAQNLLYRPEAGVIETFRKGNNVRRHNVFVLFVRPCAAGQFVRLNGSEFGKIEQRNLTGQFIG